MCKDELIETIKLKEPTRGGENKMYDDNDKDEIEVELDTVDNKIWIDSLINNIDLEDL